MSALGHAPRPAWRDAALRRYGLALAAVGALMVLPVLIVRYPPLHDYPNHLARVFILAHLRDVPVFRSAYGARWLPYPNLAFDLVMVPLQRVLPLETASRVFLVSMPVLFLLGAHRLGRAIHGRPAPAALLSAYVFFNTLYFYGFVNYTFGVALFLLAYGAWLDDRRAPSWPRLALVWGLTTASYLAHKTSFAFLALAVVTELALDRRRLSPRGVARACSAMIPVAALEWLGGVPPLMAGGSSAWDGPLGKAKGIAMLGSTYAPAIDALIAAALVVGVLVIVRAGARPSTRPLIVAAVLAATFLVFPSAVGNTWAADRRFLIPAAAVALLSLRVDLRTRPARLGYGLALLAVCARAVVVLATWPRLDREIADKVALLEVMPEGATLFGFALVDKRSKTTWTSDMGLVMVQDYATVIRHARVNGLFAAETSQPLRLLAPVPVAQVPGLDVPPEQVDWAAIFGGYEYVMGVRLDDRYRRLLAARCTVVRERGDSALFRGCR